MGCWADPTADKERFGEEKTSFAPAWSSFLQPSHYSDCVIKTRVILLLFEGIIYNVSWREEIAFLFLTVLLL
jgi:hypothetical protein